MSKRPALSPMFEPAGLAAGRAAGAAGLAYPPLAVASPGPGSSPCARKQSEVLSAIRSNLEESDVEDGVRTRMLALLDDLHLHLGLATFPARRAALVSFASAHSAELFPVVGPLIETLGDPA